MPEEVTGGKEFETHNESKKEKKEITDTSGVEIGTGPNKISKDRTEVFPYHFVGITNIDTETLDETEPKPQANTRDIHVDSMIGLL